MPLCLWIWECQWKRKSERTSVFGRKRIQIHLYLINHTITICSSSSRPKLKCMWWSPTCGHQQISLHCIHYQHASAWPYFSWSQTFLLSKIILRLTECPLLNHLSVFIAQTYEKKLTQIKYNRTLLSLWTHWKSNIWAIQFSAELVRGCFGINKFN